MGRLKVTQLRSKVGRRQEQRETLRSLGLKRIGDVVVKEERPEIRGMVHATVAALKQLEHPTAIAARRGLSLEQVAPAALRRAMNAGANSHTSHSTVGA